MGIEVSSDRSLVFLLPSRESWRVYFKDLGNYPKSKSVLVWCINQAKKYLSNWLTALDAGDSVNEKGSQTMADRNYNSGAPASGPVTGCVLRSSVLRAWAAFWLCPAFLAASKPWETFGAEPKGLLPTDRARPTHGEMGTPVLRTVSTGGMGIHASVLAKAALGGAVPGPFRESMAAESNTPRFLETVVLTDSCDDPKDVDFADKEFIQSDLDQSGQQTLIGFID